MNATARLAFASSTPPASLPPQMAHTRIGATPIPSSRYRQNAVHLGGTPPRRPSSHFGSLGAQLPLFCQPLSGSTHTVHQPPSLPATHARNSLIFILFRTLPLAPQRVAATNPAHLPSTPRPPRADAQQHPQLPRFSMAYFTAPAVGGAGLSVSPRHLRVFARYLPLFSAATAAQTVNVLAHGTRLTEHVVSLPSHFPLRTATSPNPHFPPKKLPPASAASHPLAPAIPNSPLLPASTAVQSPPRCSAR